MSSRNRTVEYPESDGKPFAETPMHRDVMIEMITTLQDYFDADPLVYVSGNMFVYFVEGDPRRNVSPDVMVVRGVDKTTRRGTFKTWVEGRTLDLVIEVTSAKTRREDLRYKFHLYQDKLRVSEYYVFDPLGEYLDPPLQGYRLMGDAYQPIPVVDGRVPSVELGLNLEAQGQRLRLFDPTTGRLLLNRLEMVKASRALNDRYDRLIEIRKALIEKQNEALQLHREIEELRAVLRLDAG